MDKEKVFGNANSLFNSVLAKFSGINKGDQEKIENDNDGPLLKRRKKSSAEIAYEKFTENENYLIESCNVELKSTDCDTKVTVSTEILDKIQNIELKLATTESIWANALKQLTALHELAETVKKSNETNSNKSLLGDHKIVIVLPTLPVKSINELIELDKAVSNSNSVAQSVKDILEDGDDTKYRDSHTKFIKWNICKLIKPEVANDLSWANQNGFQLKNSGFIKILIKRINIKFPMISYIYIVEQILAILTEFRSANKKLKHHSIVETPNACTKMY